MTLIAGQEMPAVSSVVHFEIAPRNGLVPAHGLPVALGMPIVLGFLLLSLKHPSPGAPVTERCMTRRDREQGADRADRKSVV